MTAPNAFASHILSPIIPQFLQTYPDIRLEMKLTGDVLNLIEHKIDVAIRLTHKPPVDRIAKRLGTYQLQICTSTDYYEQHKATLQHPQQLTEHPCLVYTSEKRSERWPFIINDKESAVYVTPRLSSNNYENILQATHAHCGVARLSSYVIEKSLREKKLVRLFDDYMPPPIPIYAVYAQSIATPPMIRAFIEYLQQEM